MSNMTFAQKALARAAGKDYVEIGEIVNANVDVAMIDRKSTRLNSSHR